MLDRILFHIRARTVRIDDLKSPLVFVHIPKTAGTSFINYLKDQFGPEHVAPPFVGDLGAIKVGDPDIRVYWGHFLLRQIRPAVPQGYYLTFLRDPVKRAFSQYKSWHDPANLPPNDPWRSSMAPDHIEAVELAQRLSFEEFILAENPRFDGQLIDVQTAMLSDHEYRHPDFLKSAKQNLKGFPFFGVVEQFDASLALLQSGIVGLGPYAVEQEKENRAKPGVNDDLSPRARRRLEHMVRHDLALYEFGLSMFEKRKKWRGIK